MRIMRQINALKAGATTGQEVMERLSGEMLITIRAWAGHVELRITIEYMEPYGKPSKRLLLS